MRKQFNIPNTSVTKDGEMYMIKKRQSSSNIFARKSMVKSLMDLMEKKPFSAITITEITAKANVSRMTYYRNYSSKEDIFRGYLDDILYDYYEEALSIPESGDFYDRENMLHCFNFIERNIGFVNSLFNGGLGNILLEGFGEYLTHKWYKGNDKVRYYELESFAGALYNVFIAWARGGRKETPEQMADIMHNIYKKENLI